MTTRLADLHTAAGYAPADWSPHRTRSWWQAWTASARPSGAEFRVLAQDTTGGCVALWLIDANPPVVYLGPDGEAAVIASDLDDYLALLASGVTPSEAARPAPPSPATAASSTPTAPRPSGSPVPDVDPSTLSPGRRPDAPALPSVRAAQATYPEFPAFAYQLEPAPSIRCATHDDTPALQELISTMGYDVPAADIADRLAGLGEDGHIVYVAVTDRVIGWVHVLITRSLIVGVRAELGGLAVDDRTQQSGAGTALLTTAERWAIRHGATSMAHPTGESAYSTVANSARYPGGKLR